MKEEALKKFDDALVAAKEALYNDGFVDGVASVQASPVDMGLPADEEARVLAEAVAQAKTEAQIVVDDLKLQLNQIVAEKAEIEGKYAADEAVIQGLKGSLDKLKSVVEILQGLGA